MLARDEHHRHAASRLGTLSLWSNRLTCAKYYLEKALSDRRWYAGFLPNPDLHYNLAVAHMRSGDYPRAAEAFRNAAKPFATGPLKPFAQLADFTASFGAVRPYRIAGAPQTTIPFVVRDPLPVVPLSVNGSAPFNVVIDTGGEGLFLAEDLARELGTEAIAKVSASGFGSKRARLGLGKVDLLTIGEITIRDVPACLWDMRAVDESVFPNLSVRGVLGTGLLMQFLSTIDYAGKRLILRRTDNASEDAESRLQLYVDDYSAPMWLVGTHLIFAKGSLDGSEARPLLVDTGLAGTGAMLRASAARAAGIPLDWSRAKPGEGMGGTVDVLEIALPSVTLGDTSPSLSRQNVPGVVVKRELPLLKGELGFDVGGLVSHAFFRKSAVTFDFIDMRLIVHRSAGTSHRG